MNSESTFSDALSEVDVAIAAGNTDRALALTDELLAAYPDAVGVWRARARAFEAADRPAQAAEALTRVVDVLPTDVGALTSQALALDASSRTGEARLAAVQALDYAPDDRHLIRVAARTGALESPSSTSRLYREALGQMNAGFLDRALPRLRRVAAEWPDRADAQLTLANALWRSGSRVAAAELCQSILDAQPDCLHAHALLLEFWRDAGPIGLDAPHARAIQRLDPDHRSLKALLGADSPLDVHDVPAVPPIPASTAWAFEDEQSRAEYVEELLSKTYPPPLPLDRDRPAPPADEDDVSLAQDAVDASLEGEVTDTVAPLEWDAADDWTQVDGPLERSANWVAVERPKPGDFVPSRAQAVIPDQRDGVPPVIEQLEWQSDAEGAPVRDAGTTQAEPTVPPAEPSTDVTESIAALAPLALAAAAAAARSEESPAATPPAAPPPAAIPPAITPPAAAPPAAAPPAPKRSADRVNAARQALEEGRWQEAVEQYERAIPTLRGKRLDAVIGDLEAASRAQPDAKWIWDLLGLAHTQRNDTDAALAAYRRAIELAGRPD